jgi:hypothetical protein
MRATSLRARGGRGQSSAQRARERNIIAHAARRCAGRQLSFRRAGRFAGRRTSGGNVPVIAFQTFSLRFADAEYDETEYQRLMW